MEAEGRILCPELLGQGLRFSHKEELEEYDDCFAEPCEVVIEEYMGGAKGEADMKWLCSNTTVAATQVNQYRSSIGTATSI